MFCILFKTTLNIRFFFPMWKLLWGLEGTFHFLLDEALFWGLHVHFWKQIHSFVELVFEY